MKKYAGAFAAILSAVIFGIAPILVRFFFAGGGNGITIAFLRSALAIPVLFLIVKQKMMPFKLSQKELGSVILFGTLGITLTTITLSVSYQYIPVGISTTLHFVYPALVTAAGILIFHDKITRVKLVSLLLALAGILCFMEKDGDISYIGIFLALFSGITYTLYMLGFEKTGLKSIHYFKLSFYFCIVTSIATGIYGAAAGELCFNLTREAWLIAFLISMIVSVGALPLFQIGIKSVGSSTAAILSTLEPITSIILGAVFLNETLTLQKLIGCMLILLSVILLTAFQGKANAKGDIQQPQQKIQQVL